MTMTGRIRRIPLTQGQFAIVDSKDFEHLNQWTWYALWAPSAQSYYAVRKSKRDPITHKQQLIKMHRVILGITCEGRIKQGDHINHNTLDNRKSNLRIVTHRENHENSRDQSKYGVGVGVMCEPKRKKKYRAEATINGKRVRGKYRSTPEEAQYDRVIILKEHHGPQKEDH